MSEPRDLRAWLQTRSPACQALATEFPHRQRLHVYIIGWTDGDDVLLTAHDSAIDYDLAVAQHFACPAALLRQGTEGGMS